MNPQAEQTRGAAVQCSTCGYHKAPIGRSVPPQLRMCDHSCPGYYQEPWPGSLWPGEAETLPDWGAL